MMFSENLSSLCARLCSREGILRWIKQERKLGRIHYTLSWVVLVALDPVRPQVHGCLGAEMRSVSHSVPEKDNEAAAWHSPSGWAVGFSHSLVLWKILISFILVPRNPLASENSFPWCLGSVTLHRPSGNVFLPSNLPVFFSSSDQVEILFFFLEMFLLRGNTERHLVSLLFPAN